MTQSCAHVIRAMVAFLNFQRKMPAAKASHKERHPKRDAPAGRKWGSSRACPTPTSRGSDRTGNSVALQKLEPFLRILPLTAKLRTNRNRMWMAMSFAGDRRGAELPMLAYAAILASVLGLLALG